MEAAKILTETKLYLYGAFKVTETKFENVLSFHKCKSFDFMKTHIHDDDKHN